MVMVRRQWSLEGKTKPGLAGWMVRKECKDAFEAELLRIHAVEAVVRDNTEQPFLRRLGVATQIHDLQTQIHTRLKGQARARQIARQAVLIFLAPDWLKRWLPYKDVDDQKEK